MAGPSTGGHTIPLETLDLLFALTLAGYTVVVTDQLSATHAQSAALGGGGRSRALSAPVVAPTLAALTNLVMGLTMAYMLILMLT